MKHTFPYYYGALIGGAIGDAMGAPVEFMNYQEIIGIMGTEGVQDLVIPPGKNEAFVTDDTQLTLFTVEGLLRSKARCKRVGEEETIQGMTRAVFRAYLRWLYTQGLHTVSWKKKDYDGWLVEVSKLHVYREPGITCLTALGKGVMGTIEHPINSSLGCGCVMRAMPVGLMENEEISFELGCHLAAITHGHPTAYRSAGVLSYVMSQIMKGSSILEAVIRGCEKLASIGGSKELLAKLNHAVELSKYHPNKREVIESLGKGFRADEALVMGIYAALCNSDDFNEAIKLAVNHSGDSDSVASITGSLVGSYVGYKKIPEYLRLRVELNKEIVELSNDIVIGYKEGLEWENKYPSW